MELLAVLVQLRQQFSVTRRLWHLDEKTEDFPVYLLAYLARYFHALSGGSRKPQSSMSFRNSAGQATSSTSHPIVMTRLASSAISFVSN